METSGDLNDLKQALYLLIESVGAYNNILATKLCSAAELVKVDEVAAKIDLANKLIKKYNGDSFLKIAE